MRLLSTVLFVSVSFGLTSVATPSSAASVSFQYKKANTQLCFKAKCKPRYLVGGGAALYGLGYYFWPSDHRSK